MNISAKDLAKFLQNSVSFDFSKETILSYNKIRRRYDDFYALENKRAFIALLNDIIGDDNQLVDIFADLQAADRGFRFFANEENRQSRSVLNAIGYFLSDRRFDYHKNDIAKVYFAINTWLCFYGANEVSLHWTVCPLCTKKIVFGQCSNLSCKKKEEEFIPIMLELQAILKAENEGKEMPLPKYFKTIEPNAEFGFYKTSIEQKRNERKAQQEQQEQKDKKKAIELAEKELVKISEKARLESEKEVPDFDSIFKELTTNPIILEALKYKDKSFEKKLNALKEQIQGYKDSVYSKKEQERQKAIAINDFKAFSLLKAKLDAELANKGIELPLEEVRELLAKADEAFNKVDTANTRYPSLYSKSEKEVIKDYKESTKPKTEKRIEERVEEERLDDAKDKLVIAIGEIEKEYERCKNLKDGASELWEKFINEIEKNEEYIDCREVPAWDAVYLEITGPIKQKLSNLLTEETEQKKKHFMSAVVPLKDKVSKAKPADKSANALSNELKAIKANKYYSSIKQSAEYKKEIAWLENKINDLQAKERAYFKRRKTAVSATSITILSLAIILYSLLAYIIPISRVQIKSTKASTNNYSVESLKDNETEFLIIDEYLPHFFLQKSKRVSSISSEAFKNNEYLKKCTLPASIERIGEGAFDGCTSLGLVVLQSNEPPKIESSSFDNCNTIFVVPEESYSAYMQSEDWARHRTKIFPNYNNQDGFGTVMFDSNGGSSVETMKTIQLNAQVSTLPTPTKEGYAFAGWYYIDAEGKQAVMSNDDAVFSTSTKLVAKWKQGVYSVSFEQNDGTGKATSADYTYGERWESFPQPTRDGYTFEGWYINDKKLLETSLVSITGNATAIAKWTANEYSVSFDYAGGESSTEQTTVIFDGKYGELPQSTKVGYTFGGWSYENESISSSTVVKAPKNHTLVAKWIPNTYTIRYEAMGGIISEETIICEYDKPVTLSAPQRAGYTFVNWECDGVTYLAGDEVLNLASTSAEFVFEANWKANTYKIKYDSDGGNVNKQEQDCIYDVDVVLETPTRNGYKFLYWSYGSYKLYGGEVASNLSSTQGDEIQLKAIWRAITYTIEYDANGGEQVNNSVLCTYDVPTILETPTRDGYTFKHWTHQGTIYEAGQSIVNLTSDDEGKIKLVAVWVAKENVITFNPNGGTGEMTDVNILSDGSVQLPLNAYAKNGYTFIGWSTQKNGSVEYKDGDTFEAGTESSYTLYAVWEANENKLILYANNGTQESIELTVKTAQTITIPKNTFTRAGYTFTGWELADGTGASYKDEAEIVMPASEESYLVAIWTANDNTIIFDANGGSGEAVEQHIKTDENKPLIACSYTRKGYKFIGWSRTKDGGVNYLDGAGYQMDASATTTLYAVWEIVNYDITYELSGAENSSSNPTSYNISSGTIVLEAPSKAGYTFDGWFLDELATQPITQIDSTRLEAITLYAKFTVNTNKLHFNPMGASGEMATLDVQTGKIVTLPSCTFTKPGYYFVGWSTENGGDVSYFASSSYEMGTEAEYTLYAVWDKAVYTISYETNGGTNSTLNPSEYHIESAEIILKSPTKAGYTFGGWYSESTMTTDKVEKISAGSTGNITLYARWIANTNTLHFNANGGTGAMNDVKLQTGEEMKALPSATFEKVGYNFAGWALTPNGSSIYANGASFEMGTDAEMTLYAVWTDFSYTISYNLDGGINNQQNPSGYGVETNTITLASPTKAGYTFMGWYSEDSLENKITQIPKGSTGNIVLYASWEANENTIIFNPNGATGSMSSIKLKTGESIKLPRNTFKKEGHTFKGWATTANGAVAYADGSAYVMGTGSTYTLYAVWQANSYVVTYADHSKTVIYGQSYGTLSKPSTEPTGYKFSHWTYNGATISAGTTVTTASSHTLTPVWVARTYTVYYGPYSKTVTYDQPYGEFNTVSKTGYTFNNWSYNGATITSNTIVKTASDHTLKDNWVVNYYTISISESGAWATVEVNGVTYSSETTISAPYNASIKVTFGANSNYQNPTCSYNGTAISSGYTTTMPAGNVSISASATEIPSGGSCFARGTLIALGNGRVVKVEDLNVGDEILSFDHATGKFVAQRVGFIFKAFESVEINELFFENGSSITLTNYGGHGMYDATLGEYVLITPENVNQFIGHEFAVMNGEKIGTTRLEAYDYRIAYVERYDVVTHNTLNCIANGFITCSDVLVSICNVFEFTSNFTYDLEKMENDINTYGLYTYEEWSEYLTEEEFNSFGGAYFKVAVGKGLITRDEILQLLWFLHSWNNI